MSLTLKQANTAATLLDEVVKQDNIDHFLPFKTKLQIATRLRKLRTDVETYQTERLALAKKFGAPVFKERSEEDKKSGKEPEIVSYIVDDRCEKKDEFMKLLAELDAAEADLESLVPLTEESLGENKLPVALIIQLQDTGVIETPKE